MAAAQAIDFAPRKSSGFDTIGEAAGASLSRSRPDYGSLTNVNQNGSFESDRVMKSGYVERRTRTKKLWKGAYLVLRPNTLSIYKNEKEIELRYQVQLSHLSAVSLLQDPKQKRDNIFGLFSPKYNYQFQARSKQDAEQWVDVIRKAAKLEEEEEEMLFASSLAHSISPAGLMSLGRSHLPNVLKDRNTDRLLSSSPENYVPPEPGFVTGGGSRLSCAIDSSGLSGNELPSHSDFSDNETQRPEGIAKRSASQGSMSNVLAGNQGNLEEQNPEKVIWQGWLSYHKSGAVKSWKDVWAVLRPKYLNFYKDQTEYKVLHIIYLRDIVEVMDISVKNKKRCFQIITPLKRERLCTQDEETLIQFMGALKSQLARRRW